MRNDVAVKKLIDYIIKILDYTKGFDLQAFAESTVYLEACVFCLSQMGELVRHMDDEYKARYPNIPWKKISGLRHHIVHDYEGIIVERIWDTITNDMPDLKAELERIIGT